MSPLSHAPSFAARPWFTGSTQQSEGLTEACYTQRWKFWVQARTLSCDAVTTLVVLSSVRVADVAKLAHEPCQPARRS